jgi:serine protease
MKATPSKKIRVTAPALASAFLFVCLASGLALAPARAADPGQAITADESYVPGEVLIQYEDGQTPQKVSVPDSTDVEALAENLDDRPNIASATPNYIARISGWLPNDPGLNPRRRGPAGQWQRRQWNLLPCFSLCYPGTVSVGRQSRGGMNVIRGWQHLRRAGRAGAAGVRIAVLDTGVAYRSLGRGFRRDPDLAARTFVPGYDFVDRDRIPLDLNGHGTHIASTIAQNTNNRRGLTGIAYGAKVIPVRVMDSNGFGTTLNIIRGIRWAANNRARVINMSLNFACGDSNPALLDAIRYATRKGIVLVGSAGNIGSQACPSLPATAPQVISVGGSTESGCVASYSFRSPAIEMVAPGGGKDSSDCPFTSANRSILQVAMIARNPLWFGIDSSWTGTSMAAAHVSAAAAAVIASGVLTDEQGPGKVRRRLRSTARQPAFAAGQSDSGFGAGIVDLGRATNPKVLPG